MIDSIHGNLREFFQGKRLKHKGVVNVWNLVLISLHEKVDLELQTL